MRKIFLILTSILLIVSLSGCTETPSGGGETDEDLNRIAQCLTEKGTKMYGAIWCSHCNNQKKAFGDAFQYIEYVECDANTDLEGAKACLEAGIQGYPTWVFGDGTRKAGEVEISQLAELAGC